MKSSTRGLIVWGALAASIAVSSAQAQNRNPNRERDASRPPAATQPAEKDRYAILIERNIFRRDRTAPRRTADAAGGSSAGAAAPRRPEESLVLTGIAWQEGRHVAFVEDTRTSQTTRVLPGKTVAAGKVVRIHADYLEFDLSGKSTRVSVGRNFAGDRAVIAAQKPASTQPAAGATEAGTAAGGSSATGVSADGTPSAPAAGAPAGTPSADDPNLSVLERMKLRRQQEISR